MFTGTLSKRALMKTAKQHGVVVRNFSQLTTDSADASIQSRQGSLQFSKAPILENFGELQFGEIPEPLKRVRDFKMTTISNGIRVATESSGSNLAGVGVFVNAGSRHETTETSGTAFMLERMRRHGSESRSGTALADELSNLGGDFQSNTDREVTHYALKVQKNDIGKATEILGDIVSNGNINASALEAEREVVRAIHENSESEYQRTTLEACHYNAFRDHMLGQPTRGDVDNLNNISA